MPSRRQFIGITGASARCRRSQDCKPKRRALITTTTSELPESERSMVGPCLHTKNGVKEFHLRAEEIDHEFAPGTRAKCWGYNGSTPVPPLRWSRVIRCVYCSPTLCQNIPPFTGTNILPSGMDGVGGGQPQIRPGETYAYEFEVQQHGTHMYHPRGRNDPNRRGPDGHVGDSPKTTRS